MKKGNAEEGYWVLNCFDLVILDCSYLLYSVFFAVLII